MATKKAADPRKEKIKLLVTAIKKTVNRSTPVPILESVLLTGEHAVVSDLETYVIIPFETPKATNVAIPSDKFMDVVSMIDDPELEMVTEINRPPSPVHFRIGDAIYEGSEEEAKIKYQGYLNRFVEDEEEKPIAFPFWCQNELYTLTEEIVNPEPIENRYFRATGGKKVIKIGFDEGKNFPITPMFNANDSKERNDQPYTEIGVLNSDDMKCLETALCFTSNDDLRPAMTGVYFEAPNNEEGSQSRICATDAHRLFFKPISALTESFILPKKAAKILLDLGGEWTLAGDGYFEMKDGEFVMTQPTITELHDPVFFYLNETDEDEGIWPRKGLKEDALKDYANRPDWEQEYSFERWVQREPKYPKINPDEKIKVEVPDLTRQPEKTLINSTNIRFTRADGVQVVTRVIDARFPDYRVVLPGGDGNVVVTMNPDELLKELKNAGKFANTATNQVVFSINGNVSLSSCDVDFEHEFQTGVEQAEIKWAPEVNHELKIAFNSKFLSEIVQRVKDEPVSVKLWAPHKAAIINDNFLLMPLMLNS